MTRSAKKSPTSKPESQTYERQHPFSGLVGNLDSGIGDFQKMKPGEIIIAADAAPLAANSGLKTLTLAVANTGDRPIQVGSHYHFFETNEALSFDRAAARGFRLNIPAGTAIRFEAGDTKEVELVALAGLREVYGLQAKVNGRLDKAQKRKPGKAGPVRRRR